VPGSYGAIGERREVRSRDGAERRGPDHEGQLATAPRRLGEVHRGVPGLQVGSGTAAEEQRAEEHQRDLVQPGSRDHHERPERAGRVREDQAPPATAGTHQPGRGHREQGAADHGEAGREAGHPGTGHRRGEQRADGEPHTDAHTADDLGDEEQRNGAPLHPADVDLGRGRQHGHSPRPRPMISFMISVVPP
jgi:hypothetical protein